MIFTTETSVVRSCSPRQMLRREMRMRHAVRGLATEVFCQASDMHDGERPVVRTASTAEW